MPARLDALARHVPGAAWQHPALARRLVSPLPIAPGLARRMPGSAQRWQALPLAASSSRLALATAYPYLLAAFWPLVTAQRSRSGRRALPADLSALVPIALVYWQAAAATRQRLRSLLLASGRIARPALCESGRPVPYSPPGGLIHG